ncbi:MAG: hypothetical protein JXP37_03530 [Coriobacteriia bacterium]|nr:hypothetical protein [Coriobacteriia bacterium]
MSFWRRMSRVVSAAAYVVLALALVACSAPAESPGFGTAPDAIAPAPHDLTTPEAAVRSYLDWVSYAYRMANSDIPAATMTPGELVRVDAYIQLNRMDGKGIDQELTSCEVRSASQEATGAVVSATEEWRYRYFSLESLAYASEPVAISYDTTYTLVASDEGWLVDRVEATPTGGTE